MPTAAVLGAPELQWVAAHVRRALARRRNLPVGAAAHVAPPRLLQAPWHSYE